MTTQAEWRPEGNGNNGIKLCVENKSLGKLLV